MLLLFPYLNGKPNFSTELMKKLSAVDALLLFAEPRYII